MVHTHTEDCISELGVTRHEGGLACGQARAHTAATAGCFHTEVRVDVGGRPAVLEITLVVTRLCRRHQHTESVRKYALGMLGLVRAACNVRRRLRAQRKHNCGGQWTVHTSGRVQGQNSNLASSSYPTNTCAPKAHVPVLVPGCLCERVTRATRHSGYNDRTLHSN